MEHYGNHTHRPTHITQVRLATLRWAMLAHLKKPPPGFESVVKEHFRCVWCVFVSSLRLRMLAGVHAARRRPGLLACCEGACEVVHYASGARWLPYTLSFNMSRQQQGSGPCAAQSWHARMAS